MMIFAYESGPKTARVRAVWDCARCGYYYTELTNECRHSDIWHRCPSLQFKKKTMSNLTRREV